MATSREVLVCDAVVAELNHPDRAWYGLWVASRLWDTAFPSEDVLDLKVSVVPLGVEVEELTRGLDEVRYRVGIDMQRKVQPSDVRTMDELSLYAQQVHDFYRNRHALDTDEEVGGGEVMEAIREMAFDSDLLYAESIWETLIQVIVRTEVAR